MQEQALKVFQSLTLALDTIDDTLRNRTAQEIEADGQRIHKRIKEINSAWPEVQSIWIFGPTGHSQVITREYPAPTLQDFSTNDYFSVPRDGHRGIYVGEIHASVTGGKPYFTFSRARYMADGKFAVELSLLPSDFSRLDGVPSKAEAPTRSIPRLPIGRCLLRPAETRQLPSLLVC